MSDDDVPTLEEFLHQKGAVGVLSVLKDRGKAYSEIESEVAITTDTLTKRTTDAVKIGLLDTQKALRDNRTVSEYALTKFGEAIVERLAVEGVVTHYESMRSHQRQLEDARETAVEWLAQNPSYFEHFPEVTEETLIDRTTDESESSSTEGDQDAEMPKDVPEESATQTETDSSEDGDQGQDGEDEQIYRDWSEIREEVEDQDPE